MKWYVVFCGRKPGVYDDWDDAREQVEGYPGAICKSYPSPEEAAVAFRKSATATDTADLKSLIFKASRNNKKKENHLESLADILLRHPEIDTDAWAVDASCMGNPGKMEYRGVELSSGREIFRVGPFEDATNNIGEFLAIVHAMALMTKEGRYHNIYSDSKTGMAWARNRAVKTQLKTTPKNRKVFELLARGVTWLNTHTFPARVMKWETDQWGEIPADFGRK